MNVDEKTTILRIDGMTCHSCVRHVDAALRAVDGVRKVQVQLRDGLVVVEHDGATTSVMIEALREAGYESTAT